jgi:uncharacterized protein YjiS (DUF1127 family)
MMWVNRSMDAPLPDAGYWARLNLASASWIDQAVWRRANEEITMTYAGTRYMTGSDSNARFGVGFGILRRIWKSIRRSVMIAGQRRALHQLSDHMLKDIGLSRADIDGIATNLIDKNTDATRWPRGR